MAVNTTRRRAPYGMADQCHACMHRFSRGQWIVLAGPKVLCWACGGRLYAESTQGRGPGTRRMRIDAWAHGKATEPKPD